MGLTSARSRSLAQETPNAPALRGGGRGPLWVVRGGPGTGRAGACPRGRRPRVSAARGRVNAERPPTSTEEAGAVGPAQSRGISAEASTVPKFQVQAG